MPGRKEKTDGTILVIAGEHSGDLLGGDVVHALQKAGYKSFFGTGGESMRAEGVELVETVESMTVVGFVEALRAYRRLKKLAVRLVDMAVERRTICAVLFDYPGFNLRIATMLKEKGIPVIYVVSPQIWGWHYSRIERIRRDVSLMLPLFTFEKEIYDKEHVPAQVIGHPLVARIKKRLREEETIPVEKGKLTVGLLPGSRRSEVMRLLPAMLDAAVLLKQEKPKVRFLLPVVNPQVDAYVREECAKRPKLGVEVYPDRSLRVMEASDFIVLASGTATLEAAWFEKPMIILYKMSPLNIFISTLVLRTRFIGMVNLLARQQAAPELLQSEVTSENIFREMKRILSQDEHRKSVIRELQFVKRSLGTGNPAGRAARAIDDFLNGRKMKKHAASA